MFTTPISPISSDCSTFTASLSLTPTNESILVEDQLEAMLNCEHTYQVQYIPCTSVEDQLDVCLPHEDWRRKICEWSYRVVDHFRIEREVVSISMNLFDRYLNLRTERHCGDRSACRCPSCQRAVDSRTFQLAAMTALYMAIKLHAEACGPDAQRKKLKLSSFVDLSRGQFTAEDLCQMERRMLATLSWKVNPTTPSNFVSYLLRLMPSQASLPSYCRAHYDLSLHVVNELARYLSELSVCFANLTASSLPSEIAYASILVAMEMLTESALPTNLRDEFMRNVEVRMICTDNIDCLRSTLRSSFWPEMLLDEGGDHPIALARDAGLLDLERVLYSQNKHMSIERKGSATSVMDVIHVVSP